MRLSNFFMPTLKEEPKEATIESHKLMLRAGLIRKLSSGLYSFLPLGVKALRKVENIVREEMDKKGALEFIQPILIPKELWEESGRFSALGDLMMKITDRGGREMILGPTHEEVFTDVVRNELRSYKDLPMNLYQIGTKFRDEIRPRFGVMRAREFVMKDAYSFHTTEKCLDNTYKNMGEAYTAIFKRCGLSALRVAADSGAMGGSASEEFMVPSEVGEDTIAVCPSCGYVANQERATCKDAYSYPGQAPLEIEEVDTPNIKTIEELEAFFNAPAAKFIKTLIFVDENNTPAVALIRGDLEVNEVKLKNALGFNEIFQADETIVLKVTGAPAGFAGPVGLKDVKVIADISVKKIVNGITGANQKDMHLKNVCAARDFTPDTYTDIRLVKDNDLCPECGKPLSTFKGVEVGHIFKLGRKYTQALNVSYLDENQKACTPIMGTYGIGVGRTLACIIELMHDENGIIWPMSVAPYHVVIIPIGKEGTEEFITAEKLYDEFLNPALPVDPLFDDRNERPGVKFKDADLIGTPLRITVGKKSLEQGCVEFKIRGEKEAYLVKLENIKEAVINAYFDKMKTLRP